MTKRLIDADEIEWHDHFDSDGNKKKYKVAYSDEMPPTIDAIPVSYIEKHIEDNYRLADEIRAKRLYDVANSIARYAAQIRLFLDGWYEEQRGEE